jgi:O-antigen/teichoic acid export membrane protein
MITLPFSLQREWNRPGSSQLVWNISWLVAGQRGGVMLQAGYFIVLARLLGRTEYGIYVGSDALVSIVSQYSSMGAGILFLRYVSQDAEKFPSFWGSQPLAQLAPAH